MLFFPGAFVVTWTSSDSLRGNLSFLYQHNCPNTDQTSPEIVLFFCILGFCQISKCFWTSHQYGFTSIYWWTLGTKCSLCRSLLLHKETTLFKSLMKAFLVQILNLCWFNVHLNCLNWCIWCKPSSAALSRTFCKFINCLLASKHVTILWKTCQR